MFATLKYHLRFNENRKFHELNNVNFKLTVDAKKIHEKLSGLNWITPQFKKNPTEEINIINQIESILRKDSRNKMVITNYSFFSVILDQKLFSPSRWHLLDGTDYPLKGNKYFISYKNLLINLIEKNNIAVIYTIFPEENSVIYNYVNNSCFQERKINNILKSYELKRCYEING